jgi:hypothetical protein
MRSDASCNRYEYGRNRALPPLRAGHFARGGGPKNRINAIRMITIKNSEKNGMHPPIAPHMVPCFSGGTTAKGTMDRTTRYTGSVTFRNRLEITLSFAAEINVTTTLPKIIHIRKESV